MIQSGVESALSERDDVALSFYRGALEPQQLTREAKGYSVLLCGPAAAATSCLDISSDLPDTRLLLFGVHALDRDNVYSVVLNRREYGFLLGYALALLTGSSMEQMNSEKRAALLINEPPSRFQSVLAPALQLGFHSVEPRGELMTISTEGRDREQLIEELSLKSVDIVLLYPGADGEPVPELYSALRDSGIAIASAYSGSFAVQTERILSGELNLGEAVSNHLQRLLAGELEPPGARILGVAGGYVGIDDENDTYRSKVPQAVREELTEISSRLQSGDLSLPLPGTEGGHDEAASH